MINSDDYLDKQKKSVDLFLGRIQPVHSGHEAIIKRMKNPVVVLVKGTKSSKDKSRNPLDAKDQIRLLKKIQSGIKVVTASTGYIPAIANTLRELGFEVSKVFAGDDRISGYQRQISSFNDKIDPEKRFDITFEKTPRITSATTVRNAVREDDFETFKKSMPKKLWDEWDFLRGKIK